MQYGSRDNVAPFDPWQIDPVTARIKAAETLRNPVVVVVEAKPSLSLAIAEVCDFLHIGIATAAEPRLVPALLRDIQPIAILHESAGMDYPVYDLLMVVAGYDPALPVMLIMPGDPQSRSALEAAQRLWELTDLTHHGMRPGIRALIDFMFLAGRKFGRTRFLPI
jgi:hypothetical protein